MNRRPSTPPATDAEAIRRVEELREKMVAEIQAIQQRIEGVDLALKILREPPF